MSDALKIAVVGTGRMGLDHVRRIAGRIKRAEVVAVVDVDGARARRAASSVPGAVPYDDAADAMALSDAQAVLIATPGHLHEAILHEALERELPILCEKPLTQDPASSWRVVQAKTALGRRRIQVGFMRRFDVEYGRLREVVASGDLGALLMLHCVQDRKSVV